MDIQQYINQFKEKFKLEKFDYEFFIKNRFELFLKDEITSSIFYSRLANDVSQQHIREQLIEHAKDEYEHFNTLLSYSHAHGIANINIKVDDKIINTNSSINNQIDLVQKLEKDAINKYKNMIIVCRCFKDVETEKIFQELLEDETEHFDDIAQFINQTRKLNYINKQF